MTVAIHTCRGNFKSTWLASGSYDYVAETAFSKLDVDGFFLEYDDERSGGFEPLRYIPKGKRVVLGLVSSKLRAGEQGCPQAAHRAGLQVRAAREPVPVPAMRLLQHASRQQPDGRAAEGEAKLCIDTAKEVWGIL